jgi:hypothetical protein
MMSWCPFQATDGSSMAPPESGQSRRSRSGTTSRMLTRSLRSVSRRAGSLSRASSSKVMSSRAMPDACSRTRRAACADRQDRSHPHRGYQLARRVPLPDRQLLRTAAPVVRGAEDSHCRKLDNSAFQKLISPIGRTALSGGIRQTLAAACPAAAAGRSAARNGRNRRPCAVEGGRARRWLSRITFGDAHKHAPNP